MTEPAETPDADDSTSQDLRSKLLGRLAMAGVLVALLLGILAFFDYLSSASDDEDEVFTKPVPVAPRKEVTQPVKPAENLPEPPPAEKTEAPQELPPPPSPAAEPATAEPEKAPADHTAANPGNVKKLPSTATSVVEPAPVAPKPHASASRAVPEESAPPTIAGPAPTRAPEPGVLRPVQQPGNASKAQEVLAPLPPTAAPRLFSGFVLQAGVFSSAQRAEELHAKLTLSGVPSTLETRVQVGPFRSRQEAEAAQAKLKALGVESILVPPRGKN